MTSLMARLRPNSPVTGPHALVQVFAGPDADHRALCGELLMREVEAKALIATLAAAEATPQLAPGYQPPALVINPGSGPVAGGNEIDALINIGTFLGDVAFTRQVTPAAARAPELDDDGRYAFRVTLDGTDEAYLVEMPGLRLSSVRWMGPESGNIFDFPRLYVDGSSWVWKYAVSAVAPPEAR